MRWSPGFLGLLLAVGIVPSRPLLAQGRLVGFNSSTIGVMYEAWSFSEAVAQPTATGSEDVLVDHVSQFSFPLTVTIPLSERWTLDVASAYASGKVVLSGTDPELGTSEYQLSGVTDTRLRATGRLSSNISLSLGLNLPTGKTSFDAEELSAFRV